MNFNQVDIKPNKILFYLRNHQELENIKINKNIQKIMLNFISKSCSKNHPKQETLHIFIIKKNMLIKVKIIFIEKVGIRFNSSKCQKII
jgi:hypothetical protein